MRMFLSGWLALFIGVTALAAVPTNDLATKVISRHFRVTGPDAGQNAVIAAYAEEAFTRSTKLTGLNLRTELFPPIRIELAADAKHPEQRVTRFQNMADGLLDQRIRVLNPERADTEDFLESLTWLLLNRLAVQAQTRMTMPPPPSVPEWLSVGLAQNLFPQYALRNRQVVLRRWQQGHITRLTAVVGWRAMPEGRWASKAICGVAVEWLLSYPEHTALISALLARAMAAQPITVAWLAPLVPNTSAARDANEQWDVWVWHWADAVPNWGVLTRQQTDGLRDALRIDQSAYTGGKSSDTRLAPEYFIEHRKEAGIRHLAEQVSAALALLSVGRPVEFQHVVTAYTGFFDTLADVPSRYRLVRLFHHAPSEKKLRTLLAAADQQLAVLEKTLDERRHYLDQVAAKIQHAASTNAPPP